MCCFFRISIGGDSEALCSQCNVFPHLRNLKLANTMLDTEQTSKCLVCFCVLEGPSLLGEESKCGLMGKAALGAERSLS